MQLILPSHFNSIISRIIDQIWYSNFRPHLLIQLLNSIINPCHDAALTFFFFFFPVPCFSPFFLTFFYLSFLLFFFLIKQVASFLDLFFFSRPFRESVQHSLFTHFFL